MRYILLIIVFLLISVTFVCCEDDGSILFFDEQVLPVPDEIKGVYSWTYTVADADSGNFPDNTGLSFFVLFGEDNFVRFYKNRNEIVSGRIVENYDDKTIIVEMKQFKFYIENYSDYLIVRGFPYSDKSNYFLKADKLSWLPDVSYVEKFEGLYECYWYNTIWNGAYGHPVVYHQFNCINRSTVYTPMIEFDYIPKVRFLSPLLWTPDNYHFHGDSITKQVYNYNDSHTTDIDCYTAYKIQ